MHKINFAKSRSAKKLLKTAEIAEKLPSDPNDPKDLSINHNYYTWGGNKIKKVSKAGTKPADKLI